MSFIDRTANIPKFGGKIHYVDGTNGNDANGGLRPNDALATIGQATTNAVTGDAINVRAGTYVEDVVLGEAGVKDFLELWCEIGVVLDGTGTCLTVAGNSCRVICREGAMKVTPAADQTGVLVTGTFCYLAEIRVPAGGVGDCGFDIVGAGADLRRCRCSSVKAAGEAAAFVITGDKIKLEDCIAGGDGGATTGYKIEGTADKFRLINCGSQGHSTGGFYIHTSASNGVIKDCSSGGGDGPFHNHGTDCIFSDFAYDGAIQDFNTPVTKTTTFAGAPTEYNIFKITGIVRIQDIVGHVTTVIPNTSSSIHLSVYSTGGEVNLTNSVSAPDINTAPVESLLVRVDDSTEALEYKSSATPAIIEYGSRAASVEVNVIADDDQDTYIRVNLTAALASGAIHWHCHYVPISDDGFVEPA